MERLQEDQESLYSELPFSFLSSGLNASFFYSDKFSTGFSSRRKTLLWRDFTRKEVLRRARKEEQLRIKIERGEKKKQENLRRHAHESSFLSLGGKNESSPSDPSRQGETEERWIKEEQREEEERMKTREGESEKERLSRHRNLALDNNDSMILKCTRKSDLQSTSPSAPQTSPVYVHLAAKREIYDSHHSSSTNVDKKDLDEEEDEGDSDEEEKIENVVKSLEFIIEVFTHEKQKFELLAASLAPNIIGHSIVKAGKREKRRGKRYLRSSLLHLNLPRLRLDLS